MVIQVVDKSLDKLILLISADWFQPFFPIFWPDVDEGRIVSIKLAARESVKDMMSGATVYWNISFSRERLVETEKGYVKRLQSIGLNDDSIDALLQRSEKNNLNDEIVKTSLWLFWTLTEHLISSWSTGPLADLDEHKKIGIQQLFRAIDEKRFPNNLEEVSNASDSEWDEYLKKLTPDLPSFLSDYAEIHIAGFEKFRVFWMEASKLLGTKLRKSLIEWYLDEVKEIADPNFNLQIPEWIR